MLETLLFAMQYCFSIVQSILCTLTQIAGLCIGYYLFELAIGRDGFSENWVKKIAKFFIWLFVIACVLNLSFLPLLSLIGGVLAGLIFGLFAAIIDRPITIPRD
jgi:hypothetical protein